MAAPSRRSTDGWQGARALYKKFAGLRALLAAATDDDAVGSAQANPHLRHFGSFLNFRNSACPPTQITSISLPSCPTQRGGSRRHGRGAGCGGRGGALDGRCLQRTAKTCGPDTPTLVSSLRSDPRNDGGKKADHRGEHGISRKPLRAGMSGVFRWLAVNTRVHTCYPMRTRGFCNGRGLVNPFLLYPLAGHLLLFGIGAGPSPDGVHERNRPADLRKA